jgi:hypothetical protein
MFVDGMQSTEAGQTAMLSPIARERASQISIESSKIPEASRFPSGLKSTDRTLLVWLPRRRSSRLLAPHRSQFYDAIHAV